MKKHNKSTNPEIKMVNEMKQGIVRNDRIAVILSSISALVLAVFSILISDEADCINYVSWALVGIGVVAGIVSISLYVKGCRALSKYEENYQYYVESKKISTALLTASKRTDYAKTCSILQATYGHAHEVHPINYCKNVLVYDVHQHLRDLCIQLKELIVNLMPNELNDDMVTVDLAFSYPSDQQFQRMSSSETVCEVERNMIVENENKIMLEENKVENINWKIITSGDHTSSGVNLHGYLSRSNSFYSYLGEQGYVFSNDKKELERDNHYIWSSKDREYIRNGSIVGTVIELKNDTPEIVFVRAYLTITTYGRKFVESTDVLSETQFEKLLKEIVINSYKTRIESELVQMFVRHGIRERYIARQTGRIIEKRSLSTSGKTPVGDEPEMTKMG